MPADFPTNAERFIGSCKKLFLFCLPYSFFFMLTLGIYFCVKLGLLQLYPAYICYKAIKLNNQKEFGSLLTFWVVSISFLAIEYFSDIFLFW